MRGNQFEQHYIEERVTVLTEGERIEGMVFYMGGSRLSDFLNSPNQQESKFLKIKDPMIYCRRSGDSISQVPFVLVARDRVVMVMTHKSPTASEPAPAEPAMGRLDRDPSPRFLR
jgi:hypothetical protein